MVFVAPLYTSATCAQNVPREKPAQEVQAVDFRELQREDVHKDHVAEYALTGAKWTALAGALAGFQEAYYKFETMPPAVSRPSMKQALTLYSIVGKKTLLAAALGGLFCATEAIVEKSRGQDDMTNGIVAGLVTGLAFGARGPMPQPIAWPLAFAAASVGADVVSRMIPSAMKGFRSYGPVESRPEWGDPMPPRPPIIDSGYASRPFSAGHYWRGP